MAPVWISIFIFRTSNFRAISKRFPAFSKVFLNSCQIWATPVNEGISFLHSFLWRKLFSTQFSVKETVFYIVFCEGNCFLHSFLWRNFAHQWSYHRWRHYYFLRILLPRSLKLNLMQVSCMGAHSQVPSQFKKRKLGNFCSLHPPQQGIEPGTSRSTSSAFTNVATKYWYRS